MKNEILLETERLYIRKWCIYDVDKLYKIMSDERVHKYTGDVPWTKERTKEYINFFSKRVINNLADFHGAAVLKNTDRIIGLTGLNPYLPNKPEIEWQLGVDFCTNKYLPKKGVYRSICIASFFLLKRRKYNESNYKCCSNCYMCCRWLFNSTFQQEE